VKLARNETADDILFFFFTSTAFKEVERKEVLEANKAGGK